MANFMECITVNKFIPRDREYFNCLFGTFDISAHAISKPDTRITPSEKASSKVSNANAMS